jgi:undecaprenyl-diphosphatase
LVFSALGAFLLNGLLKSLFHRPRPGATLLYLIDTPASFSFPSGHAMGAMGVLGGMVVVVHALRWPQALRIVVTSTAVCVIVGIALSRVYFGVHFPSDVIGGQLAGAAWISALTGYFYPRLLPGERTQVTAESGGPL